MISEINLANGMTTLVDEQDSDLINQRWAANINGRTAYATCRQNKRTVYMHRVVAPRLLWEIS